METDAVEVCKKTNPIQTQFAQWANDRTQGPLQSKIMQNKAKFVSGIWYLRRKASLSGVSRGIPAGPTGTILKKQSQFGLFFYFRRKASLSGVPIRVHSWLI